MNNETILGATQQDWEEYVLWTRETAIYPKEQSDQYLRLGLLSEVGEVAGKLKKTIRDGNIAPSAILDEVGDVFWYAARILDENAIKIGAWGRVWWDYEDAADEGVSKHLFLAVEAFYERGSMEYGILYLMDVVSALDGNLKDILDANRAKLEYRKARGVLGGSGDNR